MEGRGGGLWGEPTPSLSCGFNSEGRKGSLRNSEVPTIVHPAGVPPVACLRATSRGSFTLSPSQSRALYGRRPMPQLVRHRIVHQLRAIRCPARPACRPARPARPPARPYLSFAARPGALPACLAGALPATLYGALPATLYGALPATLYGALPAPCLRPAAASPVPARCLPGASPVPSGGLPGAVTCPELSQCDVNCHNVTASVTLCHRSRPGSRPAPKTILP